MPPAYDEPTGPPTQSFGTRTGRPLAPPPAEPEQPRRRVIPWVALAVLVASAVAALVVLLVGGDDDDDPSAGGTTTTTTTTAATGATSVDDTGGDGGTAGSSTTGDTSATSAPPAGEQLSAEETVEAYFAALAARDCETLIGYVSEASWSEGGTISRDEALATCEQDQANAPEYSLESVEVTEGGGEGDDAAVAEVSVTADGETTDAPVHLVREGGAWKIDFTQV